MGAQAVSLLEEMGYKHAQDFAGGLQEWTAAGLPVERDPVTLTTAVEASVVAARSPGSTRPFPTNVGSTSRLHQRLLELVEELSFFELFGVWLGMVVGFGVVFFILNLRGPALIELGVPIDHGVRGFLVSLYFSFVCATTIGFGDVVPQGIARAGAMGEAVTALLLFSCVVSKLVSRRQEELTAEIHRITSEDRLGRMQMNLHMVLSELHALGDLVARDHERGMQRLEGITMVFAGELQAVYDLLYRPQHLPPVNVLESLLARVASGLTELANQLDRLPAGEGCVGSLKSNLRVAMETSEKICGDCVPRSHEPKVKAWMDRVQQQGRRLAKVCDI